MTEPLPDLSRASIEELAAYARKVQELMDTRPAVIAALRDRHGLSWSAIVRATGWPQANVRRRYREFHSGEQR